MVIGSTGTPPPKTKSSALCHAHRGWSLPQGVAPPQPKQALCQREHWGSPVTVGLEDAAGFAVCPCRALVIVGRMALATLIRKGSFTGRRLLGRAQAQASWAQVRSGRV